MSNSSKLFIFCIPLASVGNVLTDCPNAECGSASINVVAPQLNFRSPSRDTVAKVVGVNRNEMHLWDMHDDELHANFFIRPAFKQSFRGDRIADCLFGTILLENKDSGECNSSKERSFKITGSNLADRDDNKDLMAENFYLPRQFSSTVTVNPRVQTILVDFNLYMTFGGCMEGLYCRLYGPYVNSRYDLRFSESEPSLGTEGYAEGFFASAAVPVDGLLDSFTAYARGDTLQNIPASTLRPTATVTAQGLQFAKISPEKITRNCFAELRFELGYNILNEEDQHLAGHLHVAAPTGSRPEPEFLFSPQCGNNRCWEIGAGMSARHRICTFDDDQKTLDFIIEADVTHMFNSLQKRTFDLKGKPLSRYMLAEKMLPITDFTDSQPTEPERFLSAGFSPGTPARPNVIFDSSYAPVANFSTREVNVSAGFQADVTALFSYTCNCFTWDLGYNFWTRSCETIKFSGCETFPDNAWALKGDSQVFGFQSTTITGLGTIDGPVALAATQSKSTIHAGRNKFTTDSVNNPASSNPNVDNSTLQLSMGSASAELDNGTSTDTLSDFSSNAPTQTNVNLSFQPILILQEDLDLCSAATKGLSHKIFTHLNYTFSECGDWKPYLGIGGEVEFGRRNRADDSCIRCRDCALSQWGVWLKAGFSWE